MELEKQLEALREELYMIRDTGMICLNIGKSSPNYAAIREFLESKNKQKGKHR